MPALFPQVLGGRIVPTRQEVYHFGATVGDARFSPGALPVWADFNDGEIVYGFPDLEGQGFKFAFDAHGPVVEPDTQSRQVGADGIARASEDLTQRFPALARAPLIHARVCQYENSSNGDFLVDRAPGHDRVWLVGAGSGHGFKHAHRHRVRRCRVPAHGMAVIVLSYSEFEHDGRKRLRRVSGDRKVVCSRLGAFRTSPRD